MKNEAGPFAGSRRRLFAAVLFTLCALPLLAMAQNSRATTYYVATTGDDNNDGTTADQPLQTIGLAVNYCQPGDTVSVADGTYNGAGNRNIDFGGIDMTVQSSSGNPANCIIDCQQSGCAFILKSGETKNSRIAGFTIQSGTGYSGNGGGIYITSNIISNAPVVNNCVFTGNSATSGGGMYKGTATNCTFNNNAASNAGGMYNGVATNCIFSNNVATSGLGGGMYNGVATNCAFTRNSATNGGSGGGMYIGTANNCTFSGNTSYGSGGGMYGGTAANCAFTSNTTYNEGGGMYVGTANNCTFTNNSTGTSGGGGGMSSCTVTNCTFTGNSSPLGGGMFGGTATSCTFTGNSSGSGGGMNSGTAISCVFTGNSAQNGGGTSDGTAASCVFTGNTATLNGGGMYRGTATNCVFTDNSAVGTMTTPGNGGGTYAVSLYFCTVVNNTAATDGGGIYLSNGSVTNCIVWGNTAGVSGPNIYDDGTSSTRAVTFSDVQGGHPVNGNINTDPLFVNSTSGNLHLSSTSPCIDKATTTVPTVPAGFAFPATDRDGGNRTVGAKPDMGAYENGGSAIIGAINFAGIAPNAPAQIVSFQFRPVGGGTILSMIYDTTADGAFYFNGLPSGSYNLWIKSPTYLSAVVPVTVNGGAVSGITATLQPGDANNDNSVDSTDFGILIGAYGSSASVPGSGYVAGADFNGDGFVDSTDFGLLIGNFNTVGAP